MSSRSLQTTLPSRTAGFDFDVVTDVPVKPGPLPQADAAPQPAPSKLEPAKTAGA